MWVIDVMKQQVISLVVIFACCLAFSTASYAGAKYPAEQIINNNDSGYDLAQAFKNQQSDVQVKGEGKVLHTLPDDNKGSRHQRFILVLPSGQTLLVAHNIDLAPRIPNVQVGDQVEFFGEYEWNDKGGVVHWTHHDPRQKHIDGWLKHKGQFYQ